MNYDPHERDTTYAAVAAERDGDTPLALYAVGSWGWCWEEDDGLAP